MKVIEPQTVFERTGYAAPHTVHCGPDGIFVSALGAPDGNGPGGTFIIDPETFDVRGRWELDRGPQQLSYDMWWHLGQDTMLTSTWGTPNMVKDGVNPELLLAGKYGSKVHVWDMRRRRHVQELELGAEQQMVLELRPAHDPRRAYGFASVVMSLKDLSSSIWLWHREPRKNGSHEWAITKIIEIPAEPAAAEKLPPLLQGFKAAAPLVTDINLSVDDRYLYVSCCRTEPSAQGLAQPGLRVGWRPRRYRPGRVVEVIVIETKGCAMRDSQIRFIRQLGFPGTQFPDSFYSALMFQPRAVGGVVALSVLLQSAWPFLALSAALWWSTLFPSFNPFDAIYNSIVAHRRGLRPLGIAPPPRRFAQGLAGTVAMVIGVALLMDVTTVAWIVQGLFVVASMAVVFRDNCAGAEVYSVLRRTP